MAKNNSRYRDKPLTRRPPSLEPQPRILIICEGTVTEPQYFDAFRRDEYNSLVNIEIDDKGGVPKTLVERAAARKKQSEIEAEQMGDSNLKYDEVWCVYDVDQHPNLPDAWQQARDNGIHLAISNPCFELWLLLHYCEQTAHIERKPAVSSLGTFIKGYKKHVPFQNLRAGYEDAVLRAKRLEEHHIQVDSEGGNPSTSVYKLTERIREFGRRARITI